jgi:protein-tyrosine phosphatase
MAPEVKAPSDLVVPTRDFGVPPEELFKFALHAAATRLIKGGHVYVGCGYGIGRTGTFIAALCKLNREVLYLTRRGRGLGDDAVRDPVEEARRCYLERAVETTEQAKFVRGLDLFWLSRRIAARIKPTVLFDKRLYGA